MTSLRRKIVWRTGVAMVVALLTLFGVENAPGVILIDGSDVGTNFVLTSTASNVSISGGLLTVGMNGNISTSLMITGGDVVINSGNIGTITMSAGSLLLDGSNVNLQSGISASGGVVQSFEISNANGPFSFQGGVQAVFEDGNMNGSVSVEDNARVYFVAPFTTNANTDSNNLVLDVMGSISGNGSNLNFDVVGQTAELFVGGSAPVIVIPEPSRAIMTLFGFIAVFMARRTRS